ALPRAGFSPDAPGFHIPEPGIWAGTPPSRHRPLYHGPSLELLLCRHLYLISCNAHEEPKRLVDGSRVSKDRGHVGRENNNVAARWEPVDMLAANATAEIILRQHVRVRFSFRLLHLRSIGWRER